MQGLGCNDDEEPNGIGNGKHDGSQTYLGRGECGTM